MAGNFTKLDEMRIIYLKRQLVANIDGARA